MNGSWHCINIMVSDPLSVCVVLGLSFVAKEERSRNLQNYTRKTLGGGHKEGYLGTRATTCDPELDRILFHEDPRLNLRL